MRKPWNQLCSLLMMLWRWISIKSCFFMFLFLKAHPLPVIAQRFWVSTSPIKLKPATLSTEIRTKTRLFQHFYEESTYFPFYPCCSFSYPQHALQVLLLLICTSQILMEPRSDLRISKAPDPFCTLHLLRRRRFVSMLSAKNDSLYDWWSLLLPVEGAPTGQDDFQ